jgi:hypothetical protein
LLIPATGLLVTAAFTTGTLSVILSNVGSAIATVAILSLLYDPFLRDIMAAEIFDRLQLRDSVVRSGLMDIGDSRSFTTPDAFAVTSEVDILPLHPLDWARHEFGDVIRAAADHRLAVKVYLPSCEHGAPLSVIADRLGTGEDELSGKLRLLPEQLVAAWDVGGCRQESTLTVYQFDGVPAVGLVVHATATVLEVGPSVAFEATEHRTVRFSHSPKSQIAAWARRQLRFAGRQELIVVGIRPVTPRQLLPTGRGPVPGAGSVATSGQVDRAEASIVPQSGSGVDGA